MNNDAVAVAPQLHKIIFENDKVRVLEVTIKPGESADMHTHPDNVTVVLAGGVLDLTDPEGNIKKFELQEGKALFLQNAEHSMVNKDNRTVKMIQIELK